MTIWATARGGVSFCAPVIRCFGENSRCDIDFAVFYILPVPTSLTAKWRRVKIGSLIRFLRAHHARNATPPLCAWLTRSQRRKICPSHPIGPPSHRHANPPLDSRLAHQNPSNNFTVHICKYGAESSSEANRRLNANFQKWRLDGAWIMHLPANQPKAVPEQGRAGWASKSRDLRPFRPATFRIWVLQPYTSNP